MGEDEGSRMRRCDIAYCRDRVQYWVKTRPRDGEGQNRKWRLCGLHAGDFPLTGHWEVISTRRAPC